jgi:hypothetical protein
MEIAAIACGEQQSGDMDYYWALRNVGIPLIVSQELCERFGVDGWPYAILLENGAVRSKGTVNTLQHLESLLGQIKYVALGVPSARERLATRTVSRDGS